MRVGREWGREWGMGPKGRGDGGFASAAVAPPPSDPPPPPALLSELLLQGIPGSWAGGVADVVLSSCYCRRHRHRYWHLPLVNAI